MPARQGPGSGHIGAMQTIRLLALLLSVASATLAGFAATAKPATRVRDEIPAQYRWDFTPIYPSWEAWDTGMKDMQAKMTSSPP